MHFNNNISIYVQGNNNLGFSLSQDAVQLQDWTEDVVRNHLALFLRLMESQPSLIHELA